MPQILWVPPAFTVCRTAMELATQPQCICLQDRKSGRGHVSVTPVGAPVTALMVREDHTMLGVGTAGGHTGQRLSCSQRGWAGLLWAGVRCAGRGSCPAWPACVRARRAMLLPCLVSPSSAPPAACPCADGVVQLYDPRNTRQPVKTLRLRGGPVASLHWQHRFLSLSRQRSAAVPTGVSKPTTAALQPSARPSAAATGVALTPPAAASVPSIGPRIPAVAASSGDASTAGNSVWHSMWAQQRLMSACSVWRACCRAQSLDFDTVAAVVLHICSSAASLAALRHAAIVKLSHSACSVQQTCLWLSTCALVSWCSWRRLATCYVCQLWHAAASWRRCSCTPCMAVAT